MLTSIALHLLQMNRKRAVQIFKSPVARTLLQKWTEGSLCSLLPASFFYHRLLRSPWELPKLNKALTIGFYTLWAAKLSEGMIQLCSSTNISETMWKSEGLEPGFPPQSDPVSWGFTGEGLSHRVNSSNPKFHQPQCVPLPWICSSVQCSFPKQVCWRLAEQLNLTEPLRNMQYLNFSHWAEDTDLTTLA